MKPEFVYYSQEYKELLPVLEIDFVNDCFYVLPTAELEGGNWIAVQGLEKLQQVSGKDSHEGGGNSGE